MTQLTHEITVSATPAKVWDVLSDLTTVGEYNPTVAGVKIVGPHRQGVGAARECRLLPKGRVTERVTMWEPNSALGLEVTQSDWPIEYMRWRTSLIALGDGTRISQNLEYKVKFGPIGSLLDLLVMRKKIDGAITEVFARMKQYVETGKAA